MEGQWLHLLANDYTDTTIQRNRLGNQHWIFQLTAGYITFLVQYIRLILLNILTLILILHLIRGSNRLRPIEGKSLFVKFISRGLV